MPLPGVWVTGWVWIPQAFAWISSYKQELIMFYQTLWEVNSKKEFGVSVGMWLCLLCAPLDLIYPMSELSKCISNVKKQN